MAATATRPQRQATPERWQAALRRALDEGVQVRQVVGCGLWVATSGTDVTKAYAVQVHNGIARGCECPAGEFGDPICKHRAAYYHAAGLLDLDPEPEPEPPAPVALASTPRPALWQVLIKESDRVQRAA